MKTVLAAMSAGILFGVVAGCGGGAKRDSTSVRASAGIATTAGASQSAIYNPTPAQVRAEEAIVEREARHRGFRKDRDKDVGHAAANSGYRDDDDAHFLALYGRPVGADVMRAVVPLVKRYYALAASENGRAACSMLPSSMAKVAPIDYGQFGPRYLHGTRSCAELLTRLFTHRHHELEVPIEVTGAVMRGSRVYALLGSPRIQAGFMTLERLGGAWTVTGILGSPVN